MSNVNISYDRGLYRVTMDGREISNALRRVRIDTGDNPGDLPEVSLDVMAFESDIHLDPAKVVISDEAADLLRKLGWTPPQEDA